MQGTRSGTEVHFCETFEITTGAATVAKGVGAGRLNCEAVQAGRVGPGL